MASDVLSQALENYELAKDGWADIYADAISDLNFLSNKKFAQVDPREANNRDIVGRPVVEVDQLTQYVNQVINDSRMNTPTIKVIPVGDGADVETADIIEGRIKAIEYNSNADSAYDMALDFAVRSSIGFIRVDHGFVSGKGFEQEMKIKRVTNPQAVMIDPESIEADGSDAKFAFIAEDMSVRKFKKMYPKAEPVSFGEKEASKAPELKDKITIVEYFYIEETESEIGLLEDGTTEDVIEGKVYKSKRTISKPTIMRCWLSGADVLEKPTKFPGKYIPIVPVYGQEMWIQGRRYLGSLIRKAKSPAIWYNMLKSSEIEILMKQLQSPVQAAAGQMRGFESDWETPDKAMVLYYHQTDINGDPAPKPERLIPPVVSSGYANASLDAENNIKKSMGLYSATVGKREGDSSGVALQELQRSGDLATLHFNDNLIKSIAQVGKIIVCALPEVEDSMRMVRIIGKEDEIKMVGINGEMAPDQKRTYYMNKGEWDVRVVTGASFATQRQEAAEFYSQLVTKMPDMMPIIGDLVFKYQDSPGAQAISSRLKKLVDPKLLDESERDKPEEGQINPEVEQLTAEATQVMEVAQQEIQMLQQKLAQMEQQQQTEAMKREQQQIRDQIAILRDKERIAKLEIELDLMKAKQELTQMQEQPEQEEEDSSEYELPKGLQVTKTPEALAMEDAHHSEEMMMKQQKLAMEQAEAEQRAMQAQAIIQALGGVQNTLGSLVQAVKEPKSVVFDADNNPIGIR